VWRGEVSHDEAELRGAGEDIKIWGFPGDGSGASPLVVDTFGCWGCWGEDVEERRRSIALHGEMI